MTKNIRIGILGCSAIAARSVIPAVKANAQLELVLVGSRSAAKARHFAERFACRGGSYEDVLADDSIDAVYVSLPVGLHYEWAKKVIHAKKHLLLEKTFTSSLREAQDIILPAKQNDLVAMEALAFVYHPLFIRVHQIVKSGRLGELRHIEAAFGFPLFPEGDIRLNPDLGGGAILDALVYPLSFCLQIGGVNYLDYTFKVLHDEKLGIDNRGFMQVNWKQYSAHIVYGFGFMYRNSYRVWGSKAYLESNRVFSRPADLPAEIRIIEQGKEETIAIDAADHFILMLDAFAAKIRHADNSRLNEGDDILARMKIISAMRDNAEMQNKRR